MNNINKDDLVYHGDYLEVLTPNIKTNGFTKEFGNGFYITRIYEQADRWAHRKGNTPTITKYNYSTPNNVNYKLFESMTEEWLDFIVYCIRGLKHGYDIVKGPMVDDKIYNYLAPFISGEITRKKFWLLVESENPVHQICLCTDRAISSIKYLGVDYLYE